MKMKFWLALALTVGLILGCTGCADSGNYVVNDGVAHKVRKMDMTEYSAGNVCGSYALYLVDNETGVVYLKLYEHYRLAITPLLDSEGNPMHLEDILE